MIKGKWITKARKHQKKYRVYKRYTNSGRNTLIYQNNNLAKAREEVEKIFQRGVHSGRGTNWAIFLVNEEGNILSS